MLFRIYISFLYLQSLLSRSYYYVSQILYIQYNFKTLYTTTSFGQLYLILPSLSIYSIAFNGFLLLYSFTFPLNISIFILFIPLICLISKQYSANISAYLTYFWFNFLVIKNPIKFLQSVLIINGFIIFYKNALHSFSIIIIANNFLVQMLQFSSASVNFRL